MFGKPRPLWKVILFSALTGSLYYGYYKWVIQEELRNYNDKGWSGALCLLPFVIGVALPQALASFDPDVPESFRWVSIIGIIWIYIVQFRLYRDVNELYDRANLKKPLIIWWLFIPGLNLIVGLRQIHFLSQYWAEQQGETVKDPIADPISLLSSNS
jgi:hypothetical protein